MSATSAGEHPHEDVRPAGAVDAPEGPQHTPLWRSLACMLQTLENYSRRVGSINVRAPIIIVSVLITIVFVAMAIAPGSTSVDWRGGEASWAALEKQAKEHLTPLDATADLDVQLSLSANTADQLRVEVTENITLDAAFPGEFQRIVPTRIGLNEIYATNLSISVNGVTVDEKFSHLDETYLARAAVDVEAGKNTIELSYRLDNMAFDEATQNTLAWNVLGAAWPTDFNSLDVAITAPTEIADRIVTAPEVSDSEHDWWAKPFEAEVGESSTTYRVDVNSSEGDGIVEVRMGFAPDTFAVSRAQSGTIVFALLPMVPLLLLGGVIVFAIAARRIAWGDARGRGWIVPQSEPPAIAAYVAARRAGNPQSIAVADALEHRAEADDPQDKLRIARRAKRIVLRNEPPVSTDAMIARHLEKKHHLTRKRTGIVLESFIMATIVLLAAQLAVLRQMAIRSSSIPGWWMLIVIGLTVAAAITVFVLVSGRAPLSREGALYKEHIAGIELYITQTQLRSRVTASDRLLPYVAMFSDRGEARELLDRVFPELEPAKAPRVRGNPRVRWVWLGLIVPIALVVLASVAGPIATPDGRDVYAQTHATTPEAASVAGTLTLDGDDLVLAVREEVTVLVDDVSRYGVPSYGVQYPTADGWNRWDVAVRGVWIDGAPARFRAETGDAAVAVEIEVDGAVGESFVVRIDTEVRHPVQMLDAGGTIVPHLVWDATQSIDRVTQDTVPGVSAAVSTLTIAPDVVSLIVGSSVPLNETGDGLVLSIQTPRVGDAHRYDLTLDSSLVSEQDRIDQWWRTASTVGVLAVVIAIAAALLAAAIVCVVMARRSGRWVGQLSGVLIGAAVVWLILWAALYIAFGSRGYVDGFSGLQYAGLMSLAAGTLAIIAAVQNHNHLKPPERTRSIRWRQWGSD